MQTKRTTLYIALFLLAVLLLWTGLSQLPGPRQVQLSDDVQGEYDLVDYDFSDTVYTTASVWDSWPERLYAPEQLSGNNAFVPHESVDYTQTQYATHRLRVNLVPGVTYGISFFTSDYAMRLYADGVEVECAGVPGASREETEPLVRRAAYYFTPRTETTEFVAQAANFVHREGGWAPTLTIGSAENLFRYERNEDLKLGVVFGCLMTACLCSFAVFLMNRRQRASLLFAGLCLLLALASGDYLVRLFPEYSWQFSIRFEYAVYILAAAFLTLLVRNLFPTALHTNVFRAYLFFCGGFLTLVLFSDPVFFTRLLTGFQLASVAMIVYGIFCLALTLREKKAKNVLAFLGILLFSLFIIADILHRHDVVVFGFLVGNTFNSAAGMLLFVFSYALALSIEQSEVNDRLESARKALATAEQRYLELESKKGDGKSVPARLSDFGLTKREREVALLLIDGKTREDIASLLYISLGTVNSHCTSIYRKAGCSGVADLIRRLQFGYVAQKRGKSSA